ncbi:DUF6017 domain-containing protein, partial [uncultured Oscillibacter sp.]
ELIVDVLSSTASTIRIGGEVLPVDAVRRRFRQLDSEHIKYIMLNTSPLWQNFIITVLEMPC